MAKATGKPTKKKRRARPRYNTGPFELPSTTPPSVVNMFRRVLSPPSPSPEQVARERHWRTNFDVVRVAVVSSTASGTAGSVKPKPVFKSKDWIQLHVKQWKKAGKISDRTTQDTLSRMIADGMSAAKAAGVPVRALTSGYIRSHLADFGVWPISAIK